MIGKLIFEPGRSKENHNRKLATILVTVMTLVLFSGTGLPDFAD